MTYVTHPAALVAARLVEATQRHPRVQRFAVMRSVGGPTRAGRISAYPCDERRLPAHELLGVYDRGVTLQQLVDDLDALEEAAEC
jgi:hypothetical protein